MRRGKKTVETEYERWRATLSDTDGQALAAYFDELDAHILLPAYEKKRVRADFEQALAYYAAAGVPLGEALDRLAVSRLGGFYARPPILWYPLDDAGKIYPLSLRHGQMSVFRLSANLSEPVVPALLEMALTFTIKRFPSFATTVKKGFFWHYLDTAKRRYAVEPESETPCRPLAIARSGSQSFRVLYYENRLSVEYFHVLTDGTGGMIFLKTLLAEYLRLTGVGASGGEGMLSVDDPPEAAETANEFLRAQRAQKGAGFIDRPAVQLSGRLSRQKPCRVLHFDMDAARLKEAAGRYHATVTVYLLALLFLAGKSATDELSGEQSIQVPVNMRRFYPSKTLRNFSLYCGIRLPLPAIAGRLAIMEEIARQLAEKASREAMSGMMAATERMVGLLRYVPLALKAPAARLVYGFLGDRIFTNTLSNLGVVTLPESFGGHVRSMDFVLGTALTNRASCALVTCCGVATLSISKTTADPSFEEALYALLAEDGVAAALRGTALYEN